MKRFSLLSLLFLGLLAVFVIAQAIPTYYTLNNKPYTLPEQIRTVVVGDSHNECATVILGISPNHIYTNSDNRFIYQNNFASNCIYLWNFQDFSNVGIRSDILKWINIINWTSIYTDKQITNSLGKHLPLEEKALQKSIVQFEKLRGTDSVFYGNKVELMYLDKIINLCAANDVKLILISTPIYHTDRFFDTGYFYRTLKEKYGEIEFWDYTDFELPDSYFADVHHLNKWGAEQFTRHLIADKFLSSNQ